MQKNWGSSLLPSIFCRSQSCKKRFLDFLGLIGSFSCWGRRTAEMMCLFSTVAQDRPSAIFWLPSKESIAIICPSIKLLRLPATKPVGHKVGTCHQVPSKRSSCSMWALYTSWAISMKVEQARALMSFPLRNRLAVFATFSEGSCPVHDTMRKHCWKHPCKTRCSLPQIRCSPSTTANLARCLNKQERLIPHQLSLRLNQCQICQALPADSHELWCFR